MNVLRAAWVRFQRWLSDLFPPPPPAYPYHPRGFLLTESELRFYRTLREAVAGRYVVCPKPRLADVIDFIPDHPETRWLWRITSKHVDFVLCRPQNMAILAVVELDDSSHRRPRRIDRDRFVDKALATAGVPLVRVDVAAEYSASELAERINAAITFFSGAPKAKTMAPGS